MDNKINSRAGKVKQKKETCQLVFPKRPDLSNYTSKLGNIVTVHFKKANKKEKCHLVFPVRPDLSNCTLKSGNIVNNTSDKVE